MCILTYDTAITFYSVSAASEIVMLQVGDVETPFIPLPMSKLMMDVYHERDKIDVVLDKIYNMASNATTRGRFANQVCTGAAI